MTKISLYVLLGKTGKCYVGITNNLRRRLIERKRKEIKDSQIIGDFGLVLSEEYENYDQAKQREKLEQ